MAFYHLTLLATNQSQQIVNTFDYITTSLLPSSEEASELNAEFIGNVLTPIKNTLSTGWAGSSIYTIAPYSPDVFAQVLFTPGSQVGARSGDQMPRFVAWGFKCGRLRRDIKDGAKRLSPISEGDQVGGTPLAATLILLAAAATAMKSVLTLEYVAGSSAASPAIIKRTRTTNADGSYSYHLPHGMEPLVYYEATQWTFDEITTQNTRKTGRGS